MIKRKEALKFLNSQIKNRNIIKHMLAAEAMMRVLANYFLDKGKLQPKEGEACDEIIQAWAIAGLLHDGDYRDDIPAQEQGIEVTNILRKVGYEIPENVAYCMAAHNWYNNGVEPKSLMDWSLFCGDTLTGLIVATALVRPDKKLASVKVKSVMKKFKDKSFAAGTRREDIKLCEEKLGIPLRNFVKIGVEAMQDVSNELGL